MKKLTALLIVISIACIFCGCGGSTAETGGLTIKADVKSAFEIDSVMEKDIIENMTELKDIAEKTETTDEMVAFADAAKKYNETFKEKFEDNYSAINEKYSSETDKDLKAQYEKLYVDYTILSTGGTFTTDYVDFLMEEISEEQYFETVVEYVNNFADFFFEGFEGQYFINLE